MSNRRNGKIRALAGLVDAQARHSAAEADRARLELDGRRFDDAVHQRERFVDIVEQGHADYEVKVFEYQRLLQADKPSTDFRKGNPA
ncbi:hypothetical protein [Rhodococcus opacus]|nr:hypothetical protein [Rhodococcus opacus]